MRRNAGPAGSRSSEGAPIEAADNVNMNTLAFDGECGMMDPIAPGIRAGSDTSHLAILGFDPFTTYQPARPFEAAGIGMDVKRATWRSDAIFRR